MKPGKYKTAFLGSEIPVLYITDKQEAYEIVKRLLSQPKELIAIDTETEALPEYRQIKTAALSPYLSRVRLVQIFTGRSAIVFDAKFIDDSDILKPLLEHGHFVGHNSVFDLGYFYKQFGIKGMNIGCTYLIAKLLFHATTPDDKGLSASLRSLVNTVFGEEILKEMQLSDWSVPELTWEQIEYSALDAICTYKLAERLAPKLEKYGLSRVYKLYKDAQHPIVKMQLNGIKLDVDKHRDLIVTWRDKLYKARKSLTTLTGIDSVTPTAIGKYLEKSLPEDVLSIWPRTETKKMQVDVHAFTDFSHLPLVKPFLEFKKYETLCTSFGDSLLEQVNPASGRLHPSYRLAGARTGRLSCTAPNLQQAPRDKGFRSNFVADEGKTFVLADYSSVEVRAAAEVSEDPVMLKSYEDSKDIYIATAASMLHKKYEDVTKSERTAQKPLVLGQLYGLGSAKLGKYAKKNYGVELSDDEALGQVKAYRKLYSTFRSWQVDTIKNAAVEDYTAKTITGKLRKFDSEHAWGNVVNHIIQGSCAEVMLNSLVLLNEHLPDNMCLTGSIHDEVILTCKDSDVEEAKKQLVDCMVAGYLRIFPSKKTVKKLVEACVGSSWAEAKG